MPGWRITAFIRRTARAVEVADISPKGFIRREHVGKSYDDEDALKSAIAESFRMWSRNTALPVTVAVVTIDEPLDQNPAAAPDDESTPEAENEPAEKISAPREADG